MKSKKAIDALRLEYMDSIAELANLAGDRDSHIAHDVGMNALRTPQEAEESKQVIKKTTQGISDVCNKLQSIEQLACGKIGIPALFDIDDVPSAIRVIVALLAQKSTSGTWLYEARFLNTFLQLAGGNRLEDLLIVREAFRNTGMFRPHVHLASGEVLRSSMVVGVIFKLSICVNSI